MVTGQYRLLVPPLSWVFTIINWLKDQNIHEGGTLASPILDENPQWGEKGWMRGPAESVGTGNPAPSWPPASAPSENRTTPECCRLVCIACLLSLSAYWEKQKLLCPGGEQASQRTSLWGASGHQGSSAAPDPELLVPTAHAHSRICLVGELGPARCLTLAGSPHPSDTQQVDK